MAGCQNREDDTLPCTNSTAGPVRPATDSNATVSRLVGIRSSGDAGQQRLHRSSLVSELATAATPGYYRAGAVERAKSPIRA